jgi:hypothetical protein
MKKTFFFLLLASNISFGQILPQAPETNAPGWPSLVDALKEKYFQFKENLDGYNKKNSPGDEIAGDLTASFLSNSLYQGKFYGQTPNGALLYLLPPDKMPCLAPGKDRSDKMPVGQRDRLQKTEQMPNPIPKVEVLPGKKE